MMCIWHMGMCMSHWFVAVPMAVWGDRHRVVLMQVVSIVMAVGMFVLQCFMVMRMAVYFIEVQQHTKQHQQATHSQQPRA